MENQAFSSVITKEEVSPKTGSAKCRLADNLSVTAPGTGGGGGLQRRPSDKLSLLKESQWDIDRSCEHMHNYCRVEGECHRGEELGLWK